MKKELEISIKDINAAILGKDRNELSTIFNKFNVPHKLLEKHDNITNENMVFCVNYYKIIPSYIIDLKYGVWVFHGSDLPNGRGWAPLVWTLINCEPRFTLTLFKADREMDTGMYYQKYSIPINETENIHSLREKSYGMTRELASRLLTEISCNGKITLHSQEGEPSQYRKRIPDDSELNPSNTIRELWPLIRACHNDDYPAFFRINGKKVILRYEVVDEI